MDRAGHILEKSFQKNSILLDVPGWRNLKKRIFLDAESQLPTAQDCRSSLLAQGRGTQCQSIPGFVRIPGLCSLPTLSLRSLQQSAFGVSLTYQLSLHLSAFTKIWSCDVYSHHPVGGGRSAVKIFQRFPLCSSWTKSFGCSCTTVIGSLGRRGGTAEGLSPSRNHIQALKQSDGHWNNHLFQRSRGIWCRQALASGMEIEQA